MDSSLALLPPARLAIAAALALAAPATAGAQAVDLALRPGEVLLQVEATGEALTRPDVMTITAGVATAGPTARQALDENSRLVERLISAVRSSGIEPRDVRTSRLLVSPQFSRNEEDQAEAQGRRPRILSYVANNEVELRLRDLTRAGEIIGRLFDAGANTIRGPEFSLANPKPAETVAQRAAVVDAQAEAATYADALGMRVGRVLRVSQRRSFDGEGRDNIVVTGSRIRGVPIEPGEVKTSATIWIDYALVPK